MLSSFTPMVPTVLLLLTTGNRKYDLELYPTAYIHTKFCENWSIRSKTRGVADTDTQATTHTAR
jgi:hypothetical protein